MKELEDVLASRRAAAFAEAKAVIDSPRYRSLLLDTLQWLEAGDWAKRSRRYRDRPIERFAAEILARRTKKATKKAKRLRELDTRQRHKLRIAVKKLCARAFAAGFVSGREQSEIEPLLKAADKDAQKFARIPPFWT